MKRNTPTCDLNSCFLCKNCIKEWLPAVISNKKNLHFKKGQVIFNEGEQVMGIYFVYEGVVKVHKKWGAEKELIIRFAKKGAMFGHRGLSTHSTTYPVSATALEDTVVCFIPMDFFAATIKVNTDLTRELMMFFADELQESERKMRNLAHMSVKGRVAQALINLKEQFGINEAGHINIELTRQDLSSYTGATYETVFRVVNELLAENIISVKGKKINVINLEKLTTLTSD